MTEPADQTATGGLRPRTRLGRYQIIRRIAVGGMAELYLARHVAEGGYQKVVALKRVLSHLAEDQQFVARFLNEARLAAGLDHSNIAHVIDFGSERGEHFMAMEYVHGRNAFELLRRFPECRLPLGCALTIVRDVAAALHYAHERCGPDGRPLGLVHRDVSPSNVLVSFAGDVKLVDFGIAKATADGNATRTGAILGKLAYMAPEQLRGQRVDRRADVFALCTVAYELVTGVRCFYAQGEFALINRVVAARFELPSRIRDDIPAALEAILVKGLAADPSARFTTARELQLAIEALATEAGIGLSSVALSDHMQACFGREQYPTTDVVALPTAADSADGSLPASVLRPQRRRMPVVWISAALIAGLAVGLAVRGGIGREPASLPTNDSAGPSFGPSSAPAPSVPVQAASIERTRVVAPAVSDPPARAEPTNDARENRRARARKKPTQSAGGEPTPTTPAAGESPLRDFIPPSRRKDG
jgi:serine/threonine-protein kinase